MGASPNASQDLARAGNPQELVFRGGLVKVGGLLVDEEGVGHPDLADVLRPHHEFLEARSLLEGQARIDPKLSKIHVEGEILRNRSLRSTRCPRRRGRGRRVCILRQFSLSQKKPPFMVAGEGVTHIDLHSSNSDALLHIAHERDACTRP